MRKYQSSKDLEYFDKRKPNRTYISKSFRSKYPEDNGKNIKLVSKVIDCEKGITHLFSLKNEEVLRTTPKGRQQIRIKWYEDDKKIAALCIQKFETKTSKPRKVSFCFRGEEIRKLKDFIDSVKFIDLNRRGKETIEGDGLIKFKEKIFNNIPLVKEIFKNDVTETDVVTLGYRKQQLNIFDKLLNDNLFFESKKGEWGKNKNEDVWQCFFERNHWVFGYGLNFSFNEPVDKDRLEQTVKGSNFSSYGKKVDALLKKKGIINSICLVEIKLPTSPLLKKAKEPYRSGCWSLSDGLNGGISQSQRNSQETIENIGSKVQPKGEDGTPTGEAIYSFLPKSYLIIGNLGQFKAGKEINEEKYSSFELYRKNIINPEIITFDELFERAKFIVETGEKN